MARKKTAVASSPTQTPTAKPPTVDAVKPKFEFSNGDVQVIESVPEVKNVDNETEQALADGLRRTEERFGEIQRAFRERQKRESRPGFRCPFDGKVFDSLVNGKINKAAAKKACEKWIKENFKMRAEQRKLEGQDKHTYTPVEVVVSPVITTADIAIAGLRDAQEVIAADSSQRISRTEKAIGQYDRTLTPESLLLMTEREAISKLPKMTIQALRGAIVLGQAHGKHDLTRAVRQELQNRGA